MRGVSLAAEGPLTLYASRPLDAKKLVGSSQADNRSVVRALVANGAKVWSAGESSGWKRARGDDVAEGKVEEGRCGGRDVGKCVWGHSYTRTDDWTKGKGEIVIPDNSGR